MTSLIDLAQQIRVPSLRVLVADAIRLICQPGVVQLRHDRADVFGIICRRRLRHHLDDDTCGGSWTRRCKPLKVFQKERAMILIITSTYGADISSHFKRVSSTESSKAASTFRS